MCFQDVPLHAVAEGVFYELNVLKSNRYSGFGIRVNKGNLYQDEGRPVIYTERDELIRENSMWRVVRFNMNNPHEIIDWTHEREWRYRGDYEFKWENIEVIVKNAVYYKKFIERCLKEERVDMLKAINGVIALETVLL